MEDNNEWSSTKLNHAATEESIAEQFLTLKEVAQRLGLPAFKVTRAAAAKHFPTYTLFNKRKLARLSEVIAAIDSSRTGGSNAAR